MSDDDTSASPEESAARIGIKGGMHLVFQKSLDLVLHPSATDSGSRMYIYHFATD